MPAGEMYRLLSHCPGMERSLFRMRHVKLHFPSRSLNFTFPAFR